MHLRRPCSGRVGALRIEQSPHERELADVVRVVLREPDEHARPVQPGTDRCVALRADVARQLLRREPLRVAHECGVRGGER